MAQANVFLQVDSRKFKLSFIVCRNRLPIIEYNSGLTIGLRNTRLLAKKLTNEQLSALPKVMGIIAQYFSNTEGP